MTTSRLFYAGACEGQMPDILAMIQIKRCIPAPSVLAISILSIFYIVLTDVDGLIGYLSFSTWVFSWPFQVLIIQLNQYFLFSNR